MSKKDWLYYLLLTSSAILWGSSFIFTKQLLNVAEPVTIIFSRLLIAGILFLLICLLFFRKDMKIERQDIPTVFAFSCFEPFLYFICETYSLTRCDASVVSIIVATIPIATAFLSMFYFKENFTRLNMFGIFVSFTGIFIMLFPAFLNATISALGVLLAFGAVLSSVGYMFFLRKLPEKYNPVIIITLPLLSGILGYFMLRLGLHVLPAGHASFRGGQSQHLHQSHPHRHRHPVVFLIAGTIPLIQDFRNHHCHYRHFPGAKENFEGVSPGDRLQVTGDRLQVTVGRGMAKCAAKKKLCVLFIWLAQFFRVSYSGGLQFTGITILFCKKANKIY